MKKQIEEYFKEIEYLPDGAIVPRHKQKCLICGYETEETMFLLTDFDEIKKHISLAHKLK